MIVQIEAIDTLFFRDGKPFEMGDENWANGIFPPLPNAFYGAIRTAYFSQYPEKLQEWNDGKIEDPTNELRIRGLFLYKEGSIFMSILSEFVTDKNDKEKVFFQRNALQNVDEVFSSAEIDLKPYKTEIEGAQGFLPISMLSPLKDFTNDTQNNLNQSFIKPDSLITAELKVGIGRQNATRTTEEGKLYRVALNRMEVKGNPNKKLSFLIDVNIEILGTDFQPKFLKLGGENKLATYKSVEIDIDFPKPIIEKHFKLALLTPTIFEKTKIGRQEGGWLPDCFVYDVQAKAYIGTWKGVKLKLLRAFVGGSISVGGFDVKEKQPKMMYRAVPAGTVYHFEILDNTNSETIYTIFANPDKPLSDILPEQGFGLSLLGILNN